MKQSLASSVAAEASVEVSVAGAAAVGGAATEVGVGVGVGVAAAGDASLAGAVEVAATAAGGESRRFSDLGSLKRGALAAFFRGRTRMCWIPKTTAALSLSLKKAAATVAHRAGERRSLVATCGRGAETTTKWVG
jgi:hypothetical protein